MSESKVMDRNDIHLERMRVGTFLAEHLQQEPLLDIYRTANAKMKQFLNYFVSNRIEALAIGDFTKMKSMY